MVASVFSRMLSWIVSLVIGVTFGVAATVGHASVPPLGLIVGAIGCAAILVALRMLAEDRGSVLAAGIGMFAALFVISQRGPGGSVIVPNTALGMVWMIVLGVIILAAVVTPKLSTLRAVRRPAAPAAVQAGVQAGVPGTIQPPSERGAGDARAL